MLTGWKT